MRIYILGCSKIIHPPSNIYKKQQINEAFFTNHTAFNISNYF